MFASAVGRTQKNIPGDLTITLLLRLHRAHKQIHHRVYYGLNISLDIPSWGIGSSSIVVQSM